MFLVIRELPQRGESISIRGNHDRACISAEDGDDFSPIADRAVQWTRSVLTRAHSEWLAEHCPTAELRRFPGEGHISVLRHTPAALDWLTTHWTG